MGKEIARGLVAADNRVVLAARDEAKAAAVAAEIGGATEFVRLDLASLASVRAAAAEILRRHAALRLLVNNAGLHAHDREVTQDGHERTFQTNHLGHFLLTELLRPALVAGGAPGAPARVVNVASAAHRLTGRLDLPFLLGEKGWSGWKAYAQTKLANILHARELARRLAGTGVAGYAAHPGSVRTGWGRGATSGVFRFVVRAYTPIMITPAAGARTPLAACLRDDLPPGAYLVRQKVARPSRHARDDDAARRLWDLSERLVAASTGKY